MMCRFPKVQVNHSFDYKSQPLVLHGDSGLDGPELAKPSRSWSTEHGVDTIIRLVKEASEAVTILPTGPLTNIALALSKAPEIKENIEEIVLMGGGTFGNWTPTAEFNIWADPEAAKVVFDSGVPTIVMGLDITHQALATKKVRDEISHLHNSVAKVVRELLEFFASAYKAKFDFDSPPVHDVLTVAYCIAPELFKTKAVNITIETKGEYTAGKMVVDLNHTTGREINAKFGLELDVDGFWRLMIDALKKY